MLPSASGLSAEYVAKVAEDKAAMEAELVKAEAERMADEARLGTNPCAGACERASFWVGT